MKPFSCLKALSLNHGSGLSNPGGTQLLKIAADVCVSVYVCMYVHVCVYAVCTVCACIRVCMHTHIRVCVWMDAFSFVLSVGSTCYSTFFT